MKIIEEGKMLTSAQVEKLGKDVDSDTGMGMCILWVLDDARDNTNAANIATRAVAELSQLKAERASDAVEINLATKANELLQTEIAALNLQLNRMKAEREALATLWRDYAEFLIDHEDKECAYCPVCRGEQSRGHDEDCELGILLAEKGTQ